MAPMRHNRFTNNTLLELSDINRNPLFTYEDLSIVTLDKVVEELTPFVPDILNYVLKAREKCNRDSPLLTLDEAAAIYLYSMSSFYSHLSILFRSENQHSTKPWFSFLKLLSTALKKLPSIEGPFWRGVNYDAALTYVENNEYTFWNVTACSKNLNAVKPFLGESGTLFLIDAIHGKDISQFSAVPDEQEVVLMPGTRVRCRCNSPDIDDHLFIVHLEEIEPQR